jgi:sulfoxide reductase catalytic subunit YedY
VRAPCACVHPGAVRLRGMLPCSFFFFFASCLQFTSWQNTSVSKVQGDYNDWPWPYVEGLTMAEARNDVTFMTVGIYQKVLPPQSGAPIRLTVPWKYGFKSIKSIRTIEFTDKIPVGFWENIAYSEYGFDRIHRPIPVVM